MRLLVVRCKTKECEVDLKVGEAPADSYHDGVYRVLARSVLPNPGKLTCPDCKQTHDYVTEDIETKEGSTARS